MKRLLLSFALLAGWLSGAQAEVDPNFYIYLCFGQSNMEGNARWENMDNEVDERFKMLATCNFTTPKRTLGNWYTANCPIVSPWGGLGMADYFGRTMVAALPANVKVGVVDVAIGGIAIEGFMPDKIAGLLAKAESWQAERIRAYGSDPYQRLVDMAKKAQEVGVIKGILLHQGCSNNGDPNWPKMVKSIYDNMLKDLGLSGDSVPIFVGETEYQDQGGSCYAHNAVVAKIPEVIPTGHVVSAEGIPGNGTDPWHFSAEGYRIFGRRYAEKVLDVMNHPEAYTKTFAIDERLTGGTSALVDKTFAIVNEAEGKALYGSIGRNLDYGDYKQAFDISNEGFLFKMGRITGGRALRLITPDNEVYQIDGETGYLNSQDVNGDCCFIQGLNGQRGYEIPDGAVWKPEYVEGKGWTRMPRRPSTTSPPTSLSAHSPMSPPVSRRYPIQPTPTNSLENTSTRFRV